MIEVFFIEPNMPNRLAQETSPYLQQHADNPVDWTGFRGVRKH